MKRPGSKAVEDDGNLAFALRQCNRSIRLLTTSAQEQKGLYSDPGIALITCVLFAVFQALIGHPREAIVHSLQGRKLLQNCERLAAIGQGSRLIDATSILPVIGGLEVQAKAIQGKAMVCSDTTDDPPLSDVSRLHSLQHANWTLHSTYIRLLIFCQDTFLDVTPDMHSARVMEKQRLFGPWLKTWERSFSEFLFRQGSSLSHDDMQRARVLKANHISATMLVEAAQGRPNAWAPFTAECRAIIDLSASVLNSYSVVIGPTLNAFQFPFLSFGLWVVEPLFLVMSRCHDPELRRQAAGLLHGQRPTNSQRRGSHAQEHDAKSNQRWSEDQWDTDTWDVGRWIEFVGGVRLDVGMATYFGQLPSGYIDRPQYPVTGG